RAGGRCARRAPSAGRRSGPCAGRRRSTPSRRAGPGRRRVVARSWEAPRCRLGPASRLDRFALLLFFLLNLVDEFVNLLQLLVVLPEVLFDFLEVLARLGRFFIGGHGIPPSGKRISAKPPPVHGTGHG